MAKASSRSRKISFQNKLAKKVMEAVVGKKTIFLDYDDIHDGTPNPIYDSFQYIIKPPSLCYAIRILLRPTFWVPQSYSLGEWYVKKGDLADVIDSAVQNSHDVYGRYFKFIKAQRTIRHLIKQYLFVKFFTRMVRRHYDEDPEIYRCILDEEMSYTCAFYQEESDSLLDAQNNKYEKILERVLLPEESPKVLNIGFGWGSLERYLVRRYSSAQITGLTISNSQLQWAKQHNTAVLDASRNARISLLFQDYADHDAFGIYDAVVAVGMMEHVGKGHFDAFFGKIHELLKPGGRCLIHIMIRPEPNMPTNRWIDKYIFPGGYTPSASEVVESIESTDFIVEQIYIHNSENYRKTVHEWRRNLHRNKETFLKVLSRQGFEPDRLEIIFRRWEVYLAGAEVSFSGRPESTQVAHFVMRKYESYPAH
uniref:Cyclopropane-fatty-acyl-phospholipid synthase n=1 Tax=Candidatus Kentrum sp. DK TaxID=2126562 RepID=A0A450SM89_9GAMM|nr:MAG: cyclopropane-fatty-acyl-phospholipid synthase [Candidatus Kentron sp. DK]